MKTFLILIIALPLFIVGVSTYLSPNDLADCSSAPGQSATCQPADAVVAISGGDTTARAKEAIKLFQNGWGEKLIFSGAAQDKSGPSNAKVMRELAVEAGVPEDMIIIEEYGETTKENAENTHDIFQRNNISSVILVTSAYHQRRAGLEFVKRSDGSVEVRNHPVAADKQWSNLWWLTPTGWYLAFGETAKIAIFYLGGTR